MSLLAHPEVLVDIKLITMELIENSMILEIFSCLYCGLKSKATIQSFLPLSTKNTQKSY